MSRALQLSVLPDTYSVCRFPVDSDSWRRFALSGESFVSITRTTDELSIVCRTDLAPKDCEKRSDGWRCLRFAGVLDLALTGILSSVLPPLAAAQISVFTVSTFNTDYLLVRDADLARAVNVLRRSNISCEDQASP